MNKTKTAILALLLSAGLCRAQTTVNLEWDANPPAEQVAGYRIYLKVITPPPAALPNSPPAISWQLIGTATEPKYTVTGVQPGTSVYAVSAVNAGGESARSAEVSATVLA